MNVNSSTAAAELARSLFKKHPADVIGMIAEFGDVLDELATILNLIAKTEDRPDNTAIALDQVRNLAHAGFRIASDMSNLADCQREEMHLAMVSFFTPEVQA